MIANQSTWPPLPYAEWQDSCATLHLWTQIVGKIRLAQAPLVNHWWQVPLYVTARGLTTSAMPHGARNFQIDFDFIDHRLRIEVERRPARQHCARAALGRAISTPNSWAGCARSAWRSRIWTMPVEIADPIPFDEDRVHAAYDPEHGQPVLARAGADRPGVRGVPRALSRQGEPGAFLLGQLRSRGHPVFRPPARRRRRATPTSPISSLARPIRTRSAAAGSGPAMAASAAPAFYSYAYPQPAGFAEAAIAAPGAFYNKEIGEFILPYDAVREAAAPARISPRIPGEHLRRGGRSRPMGPRRPGAARIIAGIGRHCRALGCGAGGRGLPSGPVRFPPQGVPWGETLMSILIIGGTGFIGRRLIPLLAQARRGDRRAWTSTRRPPITREFGKQVRVVRGDVSQFDDVMARDDRGQARPGHQPRLLHRQRPAAARRLQAQHPRHGQLLRGGAPRRGQPGRLCQFGGGLGRAEILWRAHRRRGRFQPRPRAIRDAQDLQRVAGAGLPRKARHGDHDDPPGQRHRPGQDRRLGRPRLLHHQPGARQAGQVPLQGRDALRRSMSTRSPRSSPA